MASLTKKADSPFWQLKRKHNGKWVRESLGLRIDDPVETAQARKIRADHESKELIESPILRVGWDWVDGYFQKSGLGDNSIIRYGTAWSWLSSWLHEQRLDIASVRYSHCLAYIDWRTGRRKRTGKAAGRNTAIQEVKILQNILNEAVRRNLIAANPLATLKLKKDSVPKKRAFTDEEVNRIRAALRLTGPEADPEWMKIAFDVALYTGCRLRETRIPMASIELDDEIPTITFPHPKGGESESFTVVIPDGLMPLLRELQATERTHTIDAFPFQPSRRWQQFFEKLKIKNVCFHCLRVTKVTLLRRQGVPREAAMRMVNHSSELIHMGYDRHQVAHLAQYRNAGVAGSAAAK